MRCLIAVIIVLVVVLALACAAFVLAWNWYGWWGVLGVVAGGFVLLWCLARFGPAANRGFVRELLRQTAGPMVNARITVHGVTPADEADAVPAMLREFDAWLDGLKRASDSRGLYIPVDEFLTHNEERPELARWYVDITVSPPDSHPFAEWSPHSISLRTAESQDSSACVLHEVQRYDPQAGVFGPFLETAYQEISGEKRIRLHVSLDPAIRDYQFEYAFVNPLDATIEVPTLPPREDPLRRFAEASSIASPA